MKRVKILLVSMLCALTAMSVAFGCTNNEKPSAPTDPAEVVLADFEKWAPDFQTLRLRNDFGAIDVNTDAAYVKSGKQSAALTVVGAKGSEMPYFFVNTVSALFDYDYSDFSSIDSVSAWVYNKSESEEKLHVGLISDVVSIEQVGLQKYDTFTLQAGWNEIVYKPDMNYVISAVGKDKYDGVKGVYFMFDNPHAASKAEGKQFYVDDIKLNYGEKKPFTEVRAGSYYAPGSQIGAPKWIVLDNPVKMEDLTDKALSFEFKFASDTGRFGFAIMCDDSNWSNITGTLIIEKNANGEIVSNVGKIAEAQDGWYAWKLNKDMFAGNGAANAKDVSLIYHQGETVQGEVIIDWNSMRAVDAYELTREERSEKYTDGNKVFQYFYEKGVAMDDLNGKALSFEFKFTSETGKFGFTFMDDKRDWANVTGELIIEKNANGEIVSNIGKIAEMQDGWYAWKLNRDTFSGNGADRAQIVDLAFTNNDACVGTVLIDWNSLKAVDAYEVTREERASRYVTNAEINANYAGQPTLFEPIDIAEFDGKAVSFEFKFVSDTGKFGFAILDNPGWANITGTLIIEKNANGEIVSNVGKIAEAQDGWYAWKLNCDMFAGDGAANAKNIGLIYCQSEKVQGEVLIDWDSLKAVDAYTVSHYDYVLDFETDNEAEICTRSYADSRISSYEISGEQAKHGSKSIKVRQNQSGALIIKLPDAMKDKITNESKLTIRFMITRAYKDDQTALNKATMNFFACSVPNSSTDKVESTWQDCKISDNGVDSGPLDVGDTWRSIQISGALLSAIKTNGYLWMNCTMDTTNWQSHEFYVDYVTLE